MQQTSFEIQVHKDGLWTPAVNVRVMGPEQCRLDYMVGYLYSDNPSPIALTMPLDWESDQRIETIGQDAQFDYRCPSFLYDLVPQGPGRRYLVNHLKVADQDSMVLPLIAVGAFSPIGNLRVSSAVDFYNSHVESEVLRSKQLHGFELPEFLERESKVMEHLQVHGMLASGTTGVQGAAPKFLLTQDVNDLWHADAALDDSLAKKHWIAKLTRGKSAQDIEVLQNEHAYLRVAALCGLDCAVSELHQDILLLERFDRHSFLDINNHRSVRRIHQESAASLAGLRGFGVTTSQNEILNALRRYCTDPLQTTIDYLKRDVLNLALRNTDNHARNTAVQMLPNGVVQLTPLFDFAPMFLDPEVITRSVHWRDERGARVDEWDRIIDSINAPESELRTIKAELLEFAEIVGNLRETCIAAGVSKSIIDLCKHHIDDQAQSLSRISISTAHQHKG